MPNEPVLFVRSNDELTTALEKVVATERRLRPGARVTKSDVVRLLLWEAINARAAAERPSPSP